MSGCYIWYSEEGTSGLASPLHACSGGGIMIYLVYFYSHRRDSYHIELIYDSPNYARNICLLCLLAVFCRELWTISTPVKRALHHSSKLCSSNRIRIKGWWTAEYYITLLLLVPLKLFIRKKHIKRFALPEHTRSTCWVHCIWYDMCYTAA